MTKRKASSPENSSKRVVYVRPDELQTGVSKIDNNDVDKLAMIGIFACLRDTLQLGTDKVSMYSVTYGDAFEWSNEFKTVFKDYLNGATLESFPGDRLIDDASDDAKECYAYELSSRIRVINNGSAYKLPEAGSRKWIVIGKQKRMVRDIKTNKFEPSGHNRIIVALFCL